MKRRTSKHRAQRSPRRPSRPPPPAARPVPVGYARLDLDLVHEAYPPTRIPMLGRLEALFRERDVVEVEGLLRLVGRVLHALGSVGFSRVDHWERHPGGWLPLPEPAHESLAEPIGHLVRALESDAWKNVGSARSFGFRLSGAIPYRADVLVRRIHRERGHAITLELTGSVLPTEVLRVERALHDRLGIARVQRTARPGRAR